MGIAGESRILVRFAGPALTALRGMHEGHALRLLAGCDVCAISPNGPEPMDPWLREHGAPGGAAVGGFDNDCAMPSRMGIRMARSCWVKPRLGDCGRAATVPVGASRRWQPADSGACTTDGKTHGTGYPRRDR